MFLLFNFSCELKFSNYIFFLILIDTDMSNNSNNEEKEFQNQPQFQPLNNNPRVIEIPVQHYTSPVTVPNTSNVSSNYLEPNNSDTDFFSSNRPRLFVDFNSPFGNFRFTFLVCFRFVLIPENKFNRHT